MVVSSTFSSRLRRNLTRAFLFGQSGSLKLDVGYAALIYVNSLNHNLFNLGANDKGVIMLQIQPDQIILLKADDKIVLHGWAFNYDLRDKSRLLDLSLSLPGGQLGLLQVG
ncbi:unnamed protein product [Prunus armeniaca]